MMTSLANLIKSCLRNKSLESQLRVRIRSHAGARFVLCPLLYRFITMTAIITDNDVIVITTHKYIP